MVALSLAIGDGHARRANRFSYPAIVEVAVLFLGIFICMQPPLEILAVKGPALGLSQPWHYFWAIRQPLLGARQRPNLRGILRDGQSPSPTRPA